MKTGYFEERESFIFAHLYGKVLDIGYVGWEKFHEKMKKKADVYGIDIEVGKNVENIIRGYADHLPFKNETFDFIVGGEIIEHVNEPYSFLKDCKRVLKTGGDYNNDTKCPCVILVYTPGPWKAWDFEPSSAYICVGYTALEKTFREGRFTG